MIRYTRRMVSLIFFICTLVTVGMFQNCSSARFEVLDQKSVLNDGSALSSPVETISYPTRDMMLTVEMAMSIQSPLIENISVDSFSINPLLPEGIVLNTTTGQISGTPAKKQGISVFTVTAHSGARKFETSISITVNDKKPAITYNAALVSFYVGMEISTLNLVNNGGVATGVSINPTLPPGLQLDAKTGAISGTPLQASASKPYVVTARNSGGESNFSIVLEIAEKPNTFSYSNPSSTYLKGMQINLNSPLFPKGTTATSFSILPSLPAGIVLDSGTGVISGTPSGTSVEDSYTITAQTNFGKLTTQILIAVKIPPPKYFLWSQRA